MRLTITDPIWTPFIRVFGVLGSAYYRLRVRRLNMLGQHEESRRVADKACRAAQEIYGLRSREYALALNELAITEMDLGDYWNARKKLERVAEIMDEFGTELDKAALYTNLGSLHLQLGDYREAEQYLTQSLKIHEARLPVGDRRVQPSRQALATLYGQIGDPQHALELHLKILDWARTRPSFERASLICRILDVARDYEELLRYDEAEHLYREAAEIARSIPDASDRHAPRAMRGLASYYKHSGDFDYAEALLRHAVAVESGRSNSSLAGTLTDLALLLVDRGNYADAEPLLLEAFRIRRAIEGEQSRSLIDVLFSLSVTARPGNQRSLERMRKAEAIQDHVIAHVSSFTSEHERMAYLETVRGQFEACLTLVLFHMPQDTEARKFAFELVLRRKAIASSVMAMHRGSALREQYPELGPDLEEFAWLRAAIAQATVRFRDSDPKPSEDQIRSWNLKKELLEKRISRVASIDLTEQIFACATARQVMGALPSRSALIEFVRFSRFCFDAVPERREKRWGEPCYCAFVVRAGAPESIDTVLLGQASAIDPLVAVVRRGASGRHFAPEAGRQTGFDLESARRLASYLLDPLIPLLKGSKRLFLAPEGDLCLIPFECLILESGLFLIDAGYVCSYINTGRELAGFSASRSGERAPDVSDPVVIADPNFDVVPDAESQTQKEPSTSLPRDFSNQYFHALPGTRQEGERVAQLLHVDPWMDSLAAKSRFLAVRSPAVMHVATHGFFLSNKRPRDSEPSFASLRRITSSGEENPLVHSGLAFAGANLALRLENKSRESILSAWEVTGMHLAHTELAVLSACETGIGEVHIGEGVIGLRQAFVIAGVKTLVMSLWRVDDEATKELMIAFWLKLKGGMGCAEALRLAQLELKRQPGFCDPKYWAGFICLGDLSPLPRWIFGSAR